jgi:hypothetical protein
MTMAEPVIAEEQKVRYSDQMFSECVGIASADNPPPAVDWAYQFSDGHQFDDAKGATG